MTDWYFSSPDPFPTHSDSKSFKSREDNLEKSFYRLMNLFFLRWLNNPEWTDILQGAVTQEMCAAAYAIKAHHYCVAPFLHVGLFMQQTWQQTGVPTGLQIISDSSRVTAQKVTPPHTWPSLWRISHLDPNQTRLCCHDAEANCRVSSFTFTWFCMDY